ncbi:hypothetical protein BH23PLA1_BH23PLA1_14850 [soil metagenome]
MISVIIPVLNESETVASVVDFACQGVGVGEVIVVDDGSIDGTPELAQAAGARVITSTLLGKGASMEDGTRAAQGEILLFLDADLKGLHPELIERLTGPIARGEADFVKARFSRSAGRVTTLTARPLLRLFFPELGGFEQPLSGIMAARRSLLERLRFENDYGVDVGLLIDAFASGARLVEADIGRIEHDSQSLDVLGDMAMQVARTILDRAAQYGRLRKTQLREVQEIEHRMQAELAISVGRLGHTERLALIDMDGTLLQGRFVLALADRTGKQEELGQYLDNPAMDPDERTRKIASLFQGVPREVFEQVAKELPLSPGASELVIGLRKEGYQVGIVTDSYRVAVEIVRRRVFADFGIANLMVFRRGKATGRVLLSPAMLREPGCPDHAYCKVNVLHHLAERMGLSTDRILAIGDGENDICMLKAAGQSIAYRPKSKAVQAAARHIVNGPLSEALWVYGLK